jgi:tetratricopeptide (TPR) repeat protein
MMSTHYRIRAACSRDRARLVADLDLPPVVAVVDAHRRLRGPYTGAGALVRTIADDALGRCPELGVAHSIEIATCAPELADRVPLRWTTLEWTVAPGERTRYYSRLHTLTIANGLAQLLRDYLRAIGGPRTLVVENIEEADPTDRDLVAVLLRRGDLPQLTIVVGTGLQPIPDPPGPVAISLERCLTAHATVIEAPSGYEPEPDRDGDIEQAVPALARMYVDRDGTSDDPGLLAAYESLPPAERASLHDERLASLVAAGQPSLRRGAIPYHAEHGSDPRGVGVAALKEAVYDCRSIGLYQGAVDLGLRGRALVDPLTQPELWWHFTESTASSLASLGRAAEAESLYDEARAATQDPARHMNVAYGMAMLYARHYPEKQRDFQQARAWINVSRAIASVLDDPKERAFNTVFSGNGLAFVEARQGNLGEALRLLEDGMARLDAELEPHEHRLHRVVLRYNRAQLFVMMGRLEDALTDYSAVVDIDPGFPEHHFNVGNILRQLDRNEEAIAAYDRALHRSPPFPEAYYNRGDARLELRDVGRALEDFRYTIELDPERVDAHVSLASVLREIGDSDGARLAIEAGLSVAPRHARLLCLQADLLADQGEFDHAQLVLSGLLEQNEGLAEAWALRGELAYRSDDVPGAIIALDRAVAVDDRPAIRFNRGVALQAAGRYSDAASDYEAVLAVTSDPDAEQRLGDCLRMTAAVPGAS